MHGKISRPDDTVELRFVLRRVTYRWHEKKEIISRALSMMVMMMAVVGKNLQV